MDQAERAKHPYELGVLLVHGIGQQVQGDTLVKFSEPLQCWLQRWIARTSSPTSNDNARFVSARFSAPITDIDAPARAELHIGNSAGAEPAKWLLAESWWANTFLPPSYGDLATWGFQILPWTLTSHFATRARRVVRDWKTASRARRVLVSVRLTLELLVVLVTVLLVPFLVALLLVVMVIAVLPIPRVRSLAAVVQRILSGTLGDSFVLIASPVQEAVIVGKIERDLRWLVGQGCRRVAVIAHSQGAAIAHAVIKRLEPHKLGLQGQSGEDSERKLLFITVGSGLNKLTEIRQIRSTAKPASVWYAPVGLLLLALALPEMFTTSGTRNDEYILPLWVGLSGLLFFMLGIAEAWKENRPRPEELSLGPAIKWIDLYASSDPVPNGPMFDAQDVTRQVMDARKVSNLASPLMDHVSYWRNEDDFVSQVACALSAHGNLELDRNLLDPPSVAVAAKRREWRVLSLAAARLLVTLLTVGVAIRYWQELPAITRKPLDALKWLGELIPWRGDLLKPIADHLVGVGALIMCGLVAYYALYIVWSRWNRAEVAAFFERRHFEPLTPSFAGFVLLAVAIVQTFALTIGGHGAGVAPGFIGAVMIWVAFSLAATVAIMFPVSIVTGIVGAFQKDKKHVPPPQAQDPSGRRPVDWVNRQYAPRLVLSFLVLILLTYPYLAVLAASLRPEQVWVEGWLWRLRLPDAITNASGGLPTPLWALGACILVAGFHLVSMFGGFRPLHLWFQRVTYAGPTAVLYPGTAPYEHRLEALKQKARVLEEDYLLWETVLDDLRAAEARSADGKATITLTTKRGKQHEITTGSDLEKQIKRLLRTAARDLYDVAMALPSAEPFAGALLRRVARTNPEAALALRVRLADEDPHGADRYLRMHADQPDWLLRRRIRRALELSGRSSNGHLVGAARP